MGVELVIYHLQEPLFRELKVIMYEILITGPRGQYTRQLMGQAELVLDDIQRIYGTDIYDMISMSYDMMLSKLVDYGGGK